MEISTPIVPVNRESAKKKLGMSGNDNFLWVGRLAPAKDPMTVLEGFNQFLSINHRARLFMIFQENELLDEIGELLKKYSKLAAVVHLVGKVPHQQIVDWMSAADFYVSGSYKESCGTALMEAMACGCIPVVTAIPPYRKITKDGQFGFLFETANTDSLFDALGRTIMIDRVAFSKQVMEHFQRELSFRAIADQLYLLCERLIAE
jgi:glycosyltransferase involved in cell wall biosynthesis